MTVRRQLGLGFSALIAVTLIIGIVSVGALQSSVEANDREARAMADRLSTVEGLRYNAEQVVSASRGFLLTAGARSAASYEQAKQRFVQRLRSLRSSLTGARADRLEEVERAADEYLTATERAMRDRGRNDDAERILAYFDAVMQPAHETLETALDHLVKDENAAYAAVVAASERADRTAALVIGGAIALAVALGLVLALTTTRRITEQFEREQQAREAARLASAAREELLAIVSHDLRNPLGAILINADLLKHKSLPPDIGRRVNGIGNAAHRMKHLIEEVLASASLEAGTFRIERSVEEVGPLFDKTASLFERAAEEKGIRLSFTVAPGTTAYADGERLMQVLSNLVGNALRFTPDGGDIRVGAEAVADGLRFFVSDTGPGIAADALPRLFERHWQAKRGDGGGLGLGLYIARQIIEEHGGRMVVESRPGEGATFSFTIPAAPAAIASRPDEVRAAPAAVTSLH
ncbi:MAG TPA: ATP-binding protein [Polyangia bacterium]|nr:ATP-binding protein [Polyangia bacterium]